MDLISILTSIPNSVYFSLAGIIGTGIGTLYVLRRPNVQKFINAVNVLREQENSEAYKFAAELTQFKQQLQDETERVLTVTEGVKDVVARINESSPSHVLFLTAEAQTDGSLRRAIKDLKQAVTELEDSYELQSNRSQRQAQLKADPKLSNNEKFLLEFQKMKKEGLFKHPAELIIAIAAELAMSAEDQRAVINALYSQPDEEIAGAYERIRVDQRQERERSGAKPASQGFGTVRRF